MNVGDTTRRAVREDTGSLLPPIRTDRETFSQQCNEDLRFLVTKPGQHPQSLVQLGARGHAGPHQLASTVESVGERTAECVDSSGHHCRVAVYRRAFAAHRNKVVLQHRRDLRCIEVPEASVQRRRSAEGPLHGHLLVEEHADEERGAVAVEQLVGAPVAGDVQRAAHGRQRYPCGPQRARRRTLLIVIAVVVLTFDAPDGMLEECLASLRGDSSAATRIVVVDNGDRTTAMPHELFDGIEVIRSARNCGYAGGMNLGIRWAMAEGAEAVALLNDDVTVDPGWLEPLVDELRSDPRVGAAQPKLLFADGEPPLVNSLGVMIGPDGAGNDVGYGQPDDGNATPHDIEAFTGGAVLLRSAFVEDVGLFDERYFLYYEDVDLALRGTAQGWRYRVVPVSRVRHRGSVSADRLGDRTVYLRERNRQWILWRHRPIGDIARGTWLSIRRLRWAPRRVHARALVAGVAGAPRCLIERWR